MKKIIFAIILTADAFGVHAENADITTSQYYVDSKLNEKQDAAPANDANSVMNTIRPRPMALVPRQYIIQPHLMKHKRNHW